MSNRAFFSYARADGALANWLWRALDRYRTPRELVGVEGKLGPVPDRLHKVFRDRDDLSAGRHLNEALQTELETSERLVVLCTPASAKSHWVNHEIETFLRLGREDRIFPVIGAGEPDSDNPDVECFPPALQGRGLLAADLRDVRRNGHVIGDGRDGGRLKLIAGMLGIELDQLIRRERRRQRTMVGLLTATALVFAGVATTAVIQTIASNQNEALARANAEAERSARTEADQRTQERDAEAQRATNNAREAEAQLQRAQETIARLFALRAWNAISERNAALAIKYVLAASVQSPENFSLYRGAMIALAASTDRISASKVTRPPQGANRLLRAASADGQFLYSGAQVFNLSDSSLARRLTALPHSIGEPYEGSQSTSPTGLYHGFITCREASLGVCPPKVQHDRIVVVRTSDGRVVTDVSLQTTTEGGLGVNFSANEQVLAVAMQGGVVRAFSFPSGKPIDEWKADPQELHSVRLDSQGQRLITTGSDGLVKIWTLASPEQPIVLDTEFSSYAEFSTDGLRAIVAARDVSIWDWQARSRLVALRPDVGTSGNGGGSESPLNLTEDGAFLVIRDSVWDTVSGEKILRLRSPSVFAAMLNDDRIVSMSESEGMLEWQTPWFAWSLSKLSEALCLRLTQMSGGQWRFTDREIASDTLVRDIFVPTFGNRSLCGPV